MCNRYQAPRAAEIARHWQLPETPETPHLAIWSHAADVFPRAPGPFLRARSGFDSNGTELVVGQWGLIPDFATTRHLRYSTNNARSEELVSKPSFKMAWALGQRCLIPAWTFDEPNWETGRNVWWRFARRDGTPWGLAGLWNRWTDPETGELVESYTMLTLNADAHPLMRRMHKPDPQLPPDAQDKRSVVPIDLTDVECWLHGKPEDAQALLRLAPESMFDAGPATQVPQGSLF